jgi:hypothetical protein
MRCSLFPYEGALKQIITNPFSGGARKCVFVLIHCRIISAEFDFFSRNLLQRVSALNNDDIYKLTAEKGTSI